MTLGSKLSVEGVKGQSKRQELEAASLGSLTPRKRRGEVPVDYQPDCEGVPSEGAAGVSAGAGSATGAGAGAGFGLTTRFLAALLAFFFIAFLAFFFFFAKTGFTDIMFGLWKPNKPCLGDRGIS